MDAKEELQLTELLPVKRSFIKETDNEDDAIADAFKALRNGHERFSQKKNEVNAEDGNFISKYRDTGIEGKRDTPRVGNEVQQSINEITTKYNYSKEQSSNWCDDATTTEKDNNNLTKRNSVKLKTDRIFKTRLQILRKRRMPPINDKKRGYRQDNGIRTTYDSNVERDSNSEEEEITEANSSRADGAKANGKRTLCGDTREKRSRTKKTILSGENYSLTDNEAIDPVDRDNDSSSSEHSIGRKRGNWNDGAEDFLNNRSTTAENKNMENDTTSGTSSEASNGQREVEERSMTNGHRDKVTTSNAEDQSRYKITDLIGNEDSLRRKIDAIIQENYAIEQKNNNTMQENRNESHKKSTKERTRGKCISDVELAEKKHCCTICEARFKGSGGLRTHYKVVHAAGPIFTCDECGKQFPLKERLKLHVRTHTGYKPYKCTECDKSFARGGQLVQHRRTHTQVKPYQCELCPGSFSCAANLALHVKRHNGQKDHKCEICGRAFVRRDALKKHLECLHKDVKSFLCVICNKTFKGHLPQHMRTHAQDRPHGCATCGQRFAQKSQLTVHQRTHSGQRPFRCLVCWQAFAHSTALKLHTRRHTGERPFKCAECNAGFTQLPHWKKHMRCVHGRTNPYCCKKCNTFFRIKNDLENHEKSCLHTSQMNVEEQGTVKASVPKYRRMTVEKMRLLLAVLFKRISKPERLNELGFGKRLIDEVLKDSLLSAGKDLAENENCTEFEVLKLNLATFLEWTVPKAHWEVFQKTHKTPEEILETLTINQ